MKPHLIFVDEHNSSKQNGIGTFRDTLLPLLGQCDDIKVTLVSLNADTSDMVVNTRDFGQECSLPFIDGGNWRGRGDFIWPLIRRYLKDSPKNIFMFNHSPCAENIGALKRVFPLSKVVFVIHDQGWCAPLMGDSRLLAAIERGERPETVSEGTRNHVHSYCDSERAIYTAADMVVCLSDSTRRYLRDIYRVPDEKVTLIYNGYPSDRKGFARRDAARRALGLNDDDEVLLFVARPATHKGVRAIMSALKKVRESHPRVRCAMAGNPGGFTEHWDLGSAVAANLILPGQLAKDALRLWYSAADAGVMSSYTEQCSYAALEMMNAGISIVTSDGNGLCDMFSDGRDAFVAHIGDVLDMEPYCTRLARKIDLALNADSHTRRRMAAAARRMLRTRYSDAGMAQKYTALFQDLTA